MVNEWPYSRVEDVADKVAMGPFGSSIKVSTFVHSGIPVISGQHLHGIKVEDSEFNFISEQHANKLHNSNVQRGDVVFTHAGNIGQVAYIPDSSKYLRYVISQRQFYMRCDRTKVLPEFVTYFFKTHEGQHKLLANRSSTGVPSIARPVTYLRSIEIPVPPLCVQQGIIHSIGALEDRILLNRRMNRTLEKMAAALFKSWFIDFDPVRRNAARAQNQPSPRPGGHPSPSGRGDGGAGCVEAFDALFPDSFEDSDLGPIPKGWKVKPMKDLADVNTRSIKKGYPHSRIRYMDISAVSEGCLDETTIYDLADAPSRAKRLVQTGDTIWSCVRPNRKAYLYIDEPADNLVVSTGFAVLSPRLVPASYLHQWVTTQAFVDYLTAYATGAAYPAVKADTFETANVLLPSKGILKAFHDLVGPLRARIAHNQRQNRRLAGLRDTLLPKLMSSEIEVPEGLALPEMDKMDGMDAAR